MVRNPLVNLEQPAGFAIVAASSMAAIDKDIAIAIALGLEKKHSREQLAVELHLACIQHLLVGIAITVDSIAGLQEAVAERRRDEPLLIVMACWLS